MLNVVVPDGPVTELRLPPSKRAIVSWTTPAPEGVLELTVQLRDGRRSRALPYVAFEPDARGSLDGFDDVAKIVTDVVHAKAEMVAIDVASNVPLALASVSAPPEEPPRDAAPAAAAQRELDVPACSQFDPDFPGERGWCTPASIAMLVGCWQAPPKVAHVAMRIFDQSYNGTGNWTFATAYAGPRGLAGAAAYLRDLTTVEAFIAAGLPLALSVAWNEGELPGAPLARSDGHLLVVRGFTPGGDPIVNDPAQPDVRHVYERAAFARAWLGHGGVALLVAPRERAADLARLANA